MAVWPPGFVHFVSVVIKFIKETGLALVAEVGSSLWLEANGSVQRHMAWVDRVLRSSSTLAHRGPRKQGIRAALSPGADSGSPSLFGLFWLDIVRVASSLEAKGYNIPWHGHLLSVALLPVLLKGPARTQHHHIQTWEAQVLQE